MLGKEGGSTQRTQGIGHAALRAHSDFDTLPKTSKHHGVIADDVAATMKTIEDKKVVERLFISTYGGAYDIGGDKVWDTWQIEGPDMVWYFRGYPHIHGYFHLTA